MEEGSVKEPGEVLGKDKDKGILIQTGGGVLAVSQLQYQGKKAMEWKAFLNGARNFIGAKLG
jgi:methionyl-tRNA formyltransferase